MANTDSKLLRECGLSHRFGEWHTFFTLVSLQAGKKPNMFYQHLHRGYRRLKKSEYARRVRLVVACKTIGPADIVLVWQTKDTETMKAFVDNVLVGNTHTSVTMHGPIHWGFASVP